MQKMPSSFPNISSQGFIGGVKNGSLPDSDSDIFINLVPSISKGFTAKEFSLTNQQQIVSGPFPECTTFFPLLRELHSGCPLLSLPNIGLPDVPV